MNKIMMTLVAFCLICANVVGQYSTKPIHETVKTLQVYKSGDALSYPVTYLNTPAVGIDINFDVLGEEMNQITYTVVHCDANWEPSDLSVNEYLDGFQQSYVNDYEYSMSTNIDYVHYALTIPNDDVHLKVSGNYTTIMINEDTGDTLLTACFSLVEQEVDIYGAVGGTSSHGISGKSQQLNFTVTHSGYQLTRPIQETKVVVKQNNSILRQAIDNTPTYIRKDELVYEQNPKFSFPGGGEYRVIEGVSTRYGGIGIKNIEFHTPYHHYNLEASEPRGAKRYEFKNDINGQFVVRRQESDDEDTPYEAEYIVVHFSIPMEDPILDGRIYVSGGFTYDQLNANTQMIYNNKRKAYEAHMILKQGYYNFRYYTVSSWDKKLKSAPMEMDAYQTENDYQVFFYHQPMGGRYDRLIGYKVINSLNQ